MALVSFSRGRMLVGWRTRDWSKVFYERIGEPDEDGAAELGLFCYPRGSPGRREPMEGEVKWLPHYDVANSESSTKRERIEMQKQFLTDAHRYLNTGDQASLTALEEELNQPGFSRWNSWFDEAKKWKRKNVRTRRKRRAARSAPFTGRKFAWSPRSRYMYSSDHSQWASMKKSQQALIQKPAPTRKESALRILVTARDQKPLPQL